MKRCNSGEDKIFGDKLSLLKKAPILRLVTTVSISCTAASYVGPSKKVGKNPMFEGDQHFMLI
jgi:hypothetical protein